MLCRYTIRIVDTQTLICKVPLWVQSDKFNNKSHRHTTWKGGGSNNLGKYNYNIMYVTILKYMFYNIISWTFELNQLVKFCCTLHKFRLTGCSRGGERESTGRTWASQHWPAVQLLRWGPAERVKHSQNVIAISYRVPTQLNRFNYQVA